MLVPIAAAAPATETPIKHLIVVVGENIDFDCLFATYEPPPGNTIANLLSRDIVDREGQPGPRFAEALQHRANVRDRFAITPPTSGAFATLPQPGTTYAKGLPSYVRDTRFPSDLPNGPYRITRYVAYDAPVGDPVHRFFQMWQQIDGGKMDLFTWVAVSSGEDSRTPDDPSSDTNQGGEAMGFYGMSSGDAPYSRELARTYALADNYHQPIMGGTGPNFLALSTGYAGNILMPASRRPRPQIRLRIKIRVRVPTTGTSGRGMAELIHGVRGSRSAWRQGDPGLPGDPPVSNIQRRQLRRRHLLSGEQSQSRLRLRRYAAGTRPGHELPLTTDRTEYRYRAGGNGRVVEVVQRGAHCDGHRQESLLSHLRSVDAFDPGDDQYTARQSAGRGCFLPRPHGREALPAVSFVIPPNSESGHPAYSTVYALERFVKKVVSRVQANADVWNKSAILITTDEGGGYYDSGYIQILDFFGDGTRIPLLAVSPFAQKGHVDHTYYDHVSVLKFIERNWHLPPLSERSRDRLPNPVMSEVDPYVPSNRPAIGDLMNLFRF